MLFLYSNKGKLLNYNNQIFDYLILEGTSKFEEPSSYSPLNEANGNSQFLRLQEGVDLCKLQEGFS